MIRLFVNYFTHPNPERQAEYEYCLNMNLSNTLIDRIYTLSESKVTAAVHIPFDVRPTFNDFFTEINKLAGPDDISIIANTDIYFDESLSMVNGMSTDECYALSRWDNTLAGLKPFHYWDSQDVWIFRGPVRQINADFCLGIPGCDNRIAHDLRQVGYAVSNPCQSIKAIHLHNSAIRNYTANTKAVPRPYVLVSPTRIGYPSALHKIE